MKNRSKIVVGIFCFFICMTFFSHMAKSIDFPDIFVNYQSYNSNISFNYGSLVKNATESNNYRNTLDTSIKARDFNDYDDMASLSNTNDYANYLYQQQKYEFNDDSFNLTDGNFIATYNFENLDNFSLYTPGSSSIYNVNYIQNHIDVMEIDSSSSGYAEAKNSFNNIEYGTIEYYWMSNNLGSGYYTIIFIKTGTTTSIEIGLENNKFRYVDGIWKDICSASANIWYHIRIDFECGLNGYLGLAADTFTISINGISYGSYNFYNPCSYINSVAFSSYSPNIISNVDSLGYSWFDNYTIGQNILSDYHTDYVESNFSYYYNVDLSSYGLKGFDYYDGYYYILDVSGKNIIKTNEFFNVISSTSISFVVDPTSIHYDFINDIITVFSYSDKKEHYFTSNLVFISTYIYRTTEYVVSCFSTSFMNYMMVDLTGSNELVIEAIIWNGYNYVYVGGGGYEWNFPNHPGVRGVDYDEFNDYLYVISTSIIYAYNFTSRSLLYTLDITPCDSTHDILIIENYFYLTNQNDDHIYVFTNTSNYYLNRGMLFQVYLYDSSSNLKGKLELKFDSINFINDYKEIILKSELYFYSGSFIINALYTNHYKLILNQTSELEFHLHVLIGYQTLFKKLLYNWSIYTDNSFYDSFEGIIPYFSTYKFDKMLLNEFKYFQLNEGVYNFQNEKVLGVNVNYFKNDLYGFRTLGCLDLNQKFSKFYDFGMFSDIIDIFELELPEIDEQEPPSDIWLPYLTSYIELDDNYTVSTLHLSVPYPRLQVVYTVEKYYFKRFYYTGSLFSYIGGNWGIFLDWVRALLNLIVDVLNFIILFFAEIIPNIILLGGQFVFGYLLFLAFHTLIMTFIVNTIGINLFWNLVIPLLILLGLLVCEGLMALYVLLIILVNWIFEIVIPGIIIGGTLLLSGLIALFLWLLTGFQGNYLEILNTVNSLLSQITLGFYEVFLIILTHILIVLLYFSAYLLCVEMVLIKYYYTKARGFKGRSERIYESYLSYRLVIEVPISIFNWFKRLIFRWT